MTLHSGQGTRIQSCVYTLSVGRRGFCLISARSKTNLQRPSKKNGDWRTWGLPEARRELSGDFLCSMKPAD